MKISNNVPDKERHYLSNLLVSGAGEIPDENGKVSANATHAFTVDKGFITGARKIIRGGQINASSKRKESKK